MIAVEIETSIIDHRLDIRSDLLPASAARAKVIVMYEEALPDTGQTDVLALARAARSSFPQRAPLVMTQELADLRDEWSRGP